MAEILIEVPVTGSFTKARENRFGDVVADGDNRAMGIAELTALVGVAHPHGMELIAAVVNYDLSAGSCTLRLTTQDVHQGWLDAVAAKLLSIYGTDDLELFDPDLVRVEVQKMNAITVEFSTGGMGVGVDYDPARVPDPQKFDQISLSETAFAQVEAILQERIDRAEALVVQPE